MAFKDWESFAAGSLLLPISGKTYEIPQLSAATALDLFILADEAPDFTGGVEFIEQFKPLLGDQVYSQMLRDRVAAPAMQRAALTVFVDYQLGRQAAEEFWELGSIPEALAALAAAAEKNGTAVGSMTRRRASGSTTNTRRNTKTSSKAAATRSRGAASSRSGRS